MDKYNYPIFIPSSSRFSSSSSSSSILNMENPLRQYSDAENTSGRGSNKEINKHRYAFQTRSQIDILDDGYRWRKYGQKIVKKSKFPRNYYKCTHKGCNVKKQVQRSSEDEEIVVTTYEGMHMHPIQKLNDNFEELITRHMLTADTYKI